MGVERVDYSSDQLMEFDMAFEYESFTTFSKLNFDLSEEDLALFEDARDLESANPQVFGRGRQSLVGEKSFSLDRLLGTTDNKRTRSDQPQVDSSTISADFVLNTFTGQSVTYGPPAVLATDSGKSSGGIFGEFLEDVADRALTAAINGGSIRDAVVQGVFENTAQIIQNERVEAPPAPLLTPQLSTRPQAQPNNSVSTPAESPPTTPGT